MRVCAHAMVHVWPVEDDLQDWGLKLRPSGLAAGPYLLCPYFLVDGTVMSPLELALCLVSSSPALVWQWWWELGSRFSFSRYIFFVRVAQSRVLKSEI